jgi:flagellar biosynthesis protein FlhG
MLYLPKMLEEIAARDAASFSKFRNAMEHFHPRLILNMLEDPKDADVAMKIRRSCESYLGLQIEHLGVIYRDSVQDISLASRLPVIIYKPQSLIAQAIYRIADKIMQTGDDNFDFTLGRNIDESYQEALLEAEVDFENKKEYVEELLHSGILTEGDLVETVKTQHLEISKLKKENSFLKQKLSKAITQGYRP